MNDASTTVLPPCLAKKERDSMAPAPIMPPNLWLDARRLLCPLPVIRLQERVQQLAPGDCLDVVFSDKGSLADITAWCRLHGHQILAHHSEPPNIFITVQVGQN